jgi:hypothetical protein
MPQSLAETYFHIVSPTEDRVPFLRDRALLAERPDIQEGRAEARASAPPLSRWGQFPIFTGVTLSHRASPIEVAHVEESQDVRCHACLA